MRRLWSTTRRLTYVDETKRRVSPRRSKTGGSVVSNEGEGGALKGPTQRPLVMIRAMARRLAQRPHGTWVEWLN